MKIETQFKTETHFKYYVRNQTSPLEVGKLGGWAASQRGSEFNNTVILSVQKIWNFGVDITAHENYTFMLQIPPDTALNPI